MAQRKVYIGDFNNKKKEEIVTKAIEKLKNNQGNEFYYILPNGELLRQYRQYFIDSVEHAFEINLFTFDDIVNRVLEDDFTRIIDNPSKNLILRALLKHLSEEDKLSHYKGFADMPGFINSVNDIIGDIKRALIYPNEYLERCPKKPAYLEMGLIYSEYEKTLDELNISDREGSYFKAVDLLKSNNFLKELDTIIIDEFYDFRPIELAILEQLITSDINIIINIPFKSKSDSIILEKTLKLLKDLGFEVENIKEKTKNQFESLAECLFTNEEELFDGNADINIINAPTAYLELRRIFEEIKRHHKAGLDLNKMAIIISNPNYQESLGKISAMERIPISTNKSTPLKTMPITRELLNIIESKITNFSKASLINRIKSNYFVICPENQRDEYEITLRKMDFQDLNDLKSIFNTNKSLKISIEEMVSLEDIIPRLEMEDEGILLKDTIPNFNGIVKSILNHYKIKNTILTRYRENNDETIFLRDLRTVNTIEELIEKMDFLAVFKDEISLEDYYLLLIDYLEEESVVELQGNIKGVHILNPTNSRALIKEITFITGLSQGSYPSLDTSNYFINDYNLKDLKTIGMDVKNYNERLNNEGLKFASILASCRKKLYLSYNSGQDDINIKSIFLDELLSLFKKDDDGKASINEIKINLDYLVKKSLEDVTNYDDLTNYLLKSYFNDDELDMDVLKAYNKLFPGKIKNINNKITSELNRYQDIYDDYRGVVDDEGIINDIKLIMPDKFNISYLEAYSKCPYFFMLNNLFELEEMKREYEDYSPMELGSLYHDALRKYYDIYKKDIENDIRGLAEFSFASTINTLESLIYRSSEEIGLKKDSKRDILIIEIAIKRLINFLKKDTEKTIKDKRIPYAFEIEFGPTSNPFYIEINESRIPINGKIDRIDKILDREDYIAIDYKSSSSGLRDLDDMKSGLSLQLPVYILSQEDKHMVAGAYGIINSGEYKTRIGLNPFVQAWGKSKLSQDDWDELMESTKDNIYHIILNIRQGNYQVKPLECSSFCIYKDICRYDYLVEVEE